jgi:hypothetical protein
LEGSFVLVIHSIYVYGSPWGPWVFWCLKHVVSKCMHCNWMVKNVEYLGSLTNVELFLFFLVTWCLKSWDLFECSYCLSYVLLKELFWIVFFKVTSFLNKMIDNTKAKILRDHVHVTNVVWRFFIYVAQRLFNVKDLFPNVCVILMKVINTSFYNSSSFANFELLYRIML